MSSANTLKDVYIEELRDLWSANDQMQRVTQNLSDKASDNKLKELLARSVRVIGEHTATLRSILEARGGSIGKDHCKGMEGLVAEAKKHAIEGEIDAQLRDIIIIAQYQRMSHYGLAGFGTAAAYANALGMKDDAAKLKSIASSIYKADEYASKLAERAEQIAAAKTGGGPGGFSRTEPVVERVGTVGRTEPDRSKERNTEIAVEAGRQGMHPDNKL
ncbi:MAG: ferritin-like domain-containing protein [Alphaproteobacteria bacterium]|nr:ferritin-like domain-containing protein [Alphaproteobacteria bacterium]